MEPLIEKKWFVFRTDHHEGPFSLDDVESQVQKGDLQATHYVWCEGMPDWRLVRDVSEFSPSLRMGTGATFRDIPLETEKQAPVAQQHPQPHQAAKVISQAQEPKSEERKSEKPSPAVRRNGSTFLIVGFVLLMAVLCAGSAVFILPQLSSVRFKVIQLVLPLPKVGGKVARFLSPIPMQAGMSEETYIKMVQSALQSTGISGAVFVQSADPKQPRLLIAANLKDGVRLDVRVKGISETLLNSFRFEAAGRSEVKNRWLEVSLSPLPEYSEAVFPKGEYQVYVYDSVDQSEKINLGHLPEISSAVGLPKGRHWFIEDKVFLGGKKDEDYATRLSAYHQRLTLRAQSEIAEIAQFVTTLVGQNQSTIQKFDNIRKLPAGARAREWAKFHEQWSALYNQMSQTFANWSPEALKRDYYYGSLYQRTSALADAIYQLHLAHQSLFFSSLNSDVLLQEIQVNRTKIGELISSLQRDVDDLSQKIAKAPALPPVIPGTWE